MSRPPPPPPPLCHRCATVVPSSQQTPPLTFACKCWDPWPNQSNIPLELPRSISLPHGAGTLICFHTATSSIFSFFSWSRTCHDFISGQQQQDTQIKRSKEGTYKRSAMGHTTQTTAKVALPVQFFKNDRRWMCPIQFHFQNVDATVRVELQIVFFCSFAAAARTGLTGQCIVHFVKNWVAHFHSFVVHCFVGPENTKHEKQKGLKQPK